MSSDQMKRMWGAAEAAFLMDPWKEGKALHLPSAGSERLVDAARWCVSKSDVQKFQRRVYHSWKLGMLGALDDGDVDPVIRYDFPKNQDNQEQFEDERIGPSMYSVNEQFIKPITAKAGGMSWALMCNEKGLECDIFVTHAWAEGVFEFCDKLVSSWPGGKNHGAYICFLANPQNLSIAELLDEPLPRSPFAKAMAKATHVVIIPNCKCSIYSRIWCVYEAYLAVESNPAKTITLAYHVTTSQKRRLVLKALAMFLAGLLLWLCLLYLVNFFHDHEALAVTTYRTIWRFFNFNYVVLVVPYVSYHVMYDKPLTGHFKIGLNLRAVVFRYACDCHGWVLCLWLWVTTTVACCPPSPEIVNFGNWWNRLVKGQAWELPHHSLWVIPLASVFFIFPMMTWPFCRQVYLDAMDNGAASLDFESVAAAEASSEKDKTKIMEAIQGREDVVEATLRKSFREGGFSRKLARRTLGGISTRASMQTGVGTAVAAFFLWLSIALWVAAPYIKHHVKLRPYIVFKVFLLVGTFFAFACACCVVFVRYWKRDPILKGFGTRAMFTSGVRAMCLLFITQGIFLCVSDSEFEGKSLEKPANIMLQGATWSLAATGYAFRGMFLALRGPAAADVLRLAPHRRLNLIQFDEVQLTDFPRQ